MKQRIPLMTWALAGIAGLCLVEASVVVAGAPARTVTIEGVSYKPEAITVHKGDSITWVNKDPFPHTVTDAGKFDSKEIAPNAKWTWKATKAGEFNYICTLHPNMKGTVKVE